MLPKYGKNPNANGHGRVLGPKTDTARVLGFEPGFFIHANSRMLTSEIALQSFVLRVHICVAKQILQIIY